NEEPKGCIRESAEGATAQVVAAHNLLQPFCPRKLHILPQAYLHSLVIRSKTWKSVFPLCQSSTHVEPANFTRVDEGVGAFAGTFPIAVSQTWTGGLVKLLCRENLALSTDVFLSNVA